MLQKIDYKPFLAKTLINMGVLYLRKEEYTEAIKWYRQALDTYTVMDNKVGMADACNGLALLYVKKEEYKKAEDAAVQALGFAEAVKYQGGMNYANHELDEIHEKTRGKK